MPKALDGLASSDADGDTLTYQWSIVSQPNGSSISLSSNKIATPTFTPSVAGKYTFSLSVSDSHLSSPADSVTITAGTVSLDVDGDGDADANDGLIARNPTPVIKRSRPNSISSQRAGSGKRPKVGLTLLI